MTDHKRPRLNVATRFAIMQVPILADGRMIGWAHLYADRWEIDERVCQYLKEECKFDPEWITESICEEYCTLDELGDLLEECIKYAYEQGGDY